MANLMYILANISTPIKVGWGAWILWMFVQTTWYRRATTIVSGNQWPTPKPAPAPQRSPRKRREPEAPLSVTRPPVEPPEILSEISAI